MKYYPMLAASVVCALYCSKASASEVWVNVATLCESDSSPFSCEFDGAILGTATMFLGPNSTGIDPFNLSTYPSEDYTTSQTTDFTNVCVDKVRTFEKDPNWPLEKISAGCSAKVQVISVANGDFGGEGWVPFGDPLEHGKTAIFQSDPETGAVTSVGEGSALAFLEGIACSCGALVVNPE